jgi:hypothetical protein
MVKYVPEKAVDDVDLVIGNYWPRKKAYLQELENWSLKRKEYEY